MTNEHDSDKRPFNERIRDPGFTPSPEMAEYIAKQKEQDESRRRLDESLRKLPPAKQELTLSPQQIEAIAEAVAIRVIAALKPEGAS
jgi:hypothetical protein